MGGHMLLGMPRINERNDDLGGLTPAELATIKAGLSKARAMAEGLLKRADELTARVEARCLRVPQGGPDAPRVSGERHGSC